MKEKTNPQLLFVAILLIVAGTLLPYNGIDGRSYKTPLELITPMLIAISAGALAYLAWNWIEKYKESAKISLKSNEENSLNSN